MTRLDDFAAFCRNLTLDTGGRLIVEPFQRTMLGDYFAHTRETLAILPKGSGKTTLLGALALFELVTVPDSEVVIAAAARDQAAILLRQGQGMIRRSPALQARLSVKQREIIHRKLGGRIRVLTADADTGDGVIPSLALVDELHRHRSGDLYAVLRDSLAKRDGQMITISTAGADQETPLWRARQAAIERGAERNGMYLRGGTSSFRLHEWSLVEGRDNPDDISTVKAANPASWQTEELLRERHDSPSMAPWDWRRFACNLWASAEAPWLPPGAWDECRDDELEIGPGARVFLGVDIGRKHDSSAIVACSPQDGRLVVRAWLFESPGVGEESTDLSVIEAKLRDLAKQFKVIEIAYDPWSFTRSAQMLADEGLTTVEFAQSNERMGRASARLLEAIRARRIAHNGDPVLAAHVNAGVTTETERGWRLTKRKSRSATDALVGLLMCVDRAELPRKKRGPKVIDLRAYYDEVMAEQYPPVNQPSPPDA